MVIWTYVTHVTLDDTEPFTVNVFAKDTEEHIPIEIQLSG